MFNVIKILNLIIHSIFFYHTKYTESMLPICTTVFCFLGFFVPGIELKTALLQGSAHATELYPQPCTTVFNLLVPISYILCCFPQITRAVSGFLPTNSRVPPLLWNMWFLLSAEHTMHSYSVLSVRCKWLQRSDMVCGTFIATHVYRQSCHKLLEPRIRNL